LVFKADRLGCFGEDLLPFENDFSAIAE
jgi:hypothetical protein